MVFEAGVFVILSDVQLICRSQDKTCLSVKTLQGTT
ncbi:hypothetical protein BN439_2261 [Erwinia amylovora Ea644]|nr:hypothetical protein BN439_2261 [Erwinia amylovora Ea644]CCP07326.1 hypothetical protein BN440_2304 [Erwinia amylovora MR1]